MAVVQEATTNSAQTQAQFNQDFQVFDWMRVSWVVYPNLCCRPSLSSPPAPASFVAAVSARVYRESDRNRRSGGKQRLRGGRGFGWDEGQKEGCWE